MRHRTNSVVLADIPPVGLAVLINGQRFDLIGHDAYRTKLGELTTLLVWQAECAECGATFTARTSVTRWAETRRCPAHRTPGRPVKRHPISTGQADRLERNIR